MGGAASGVFTNACGCWAAASLLRGCSAELRGVARFAAAAEAEVQAGGCRCARDVDVLSLLCALQCGLHIAAQCGALTEPLPSRRRVGRCNAARGAPAAQCDCGACLVFPKDIVSHQNKTI